MIKPDNLQRAYVGGVSRFFCSWHSATTPQFGELYIQEGQSNRGKHGYLSTTKSDRY